MAFFKFRKGGDTQSATPAQPESVETMRKRAKHRLIGAAVLVLVGVIGFPLLFDKQPRPIAVDMPIEIPDKNKVKPLSIPAPAAKDTALAEPAPAVAPGAAAEPVEFIEKPTSKMPSAHVPVAQPAPKTVAKPAPKAPENSAPTAPPAPDKPFRVDEGAKASALLEGKEPPASKPVATEGRFVVQFGSFTDKARAQEVRLKVEHLGLKTYSHEADINKEHRIRVRVGPFGSRAEAEKAADKIRKAGLSAAILSL